MHITLYLNNIFYGAPYLTDKLWIPHIGCYFCKDSFRPCLRELCSNFEIKSEH
jgi:hypothetical protein